LSVRIGIDGCCWSNRRGFGRFTRELVSRMVEEHPQHDFTLVVDQRTRAAGVFPKGARIAEVTTREQPTRAASAAGARSPADLWRLSRAASRLPLDVFFFPAVYSYFPLLRRVPVLTAFHDAIAESYPRLVFSSWRARAFWTLKCRLAARQSRAILTVSESARDGIARAFGYPPARIHVVREAPAAIFRRLDDLAALQRARRRFGLPAEAPLLLYVGGISPHKNLAGLLDAFARVASRQPCHLALVGDHSGDSFLGCYAELQEAVRRLGIAQRVTFTGFVPDDDLVALYSTATLLVQPSFDEGFGLPVAEAMACGLPVAASRRGSLPELLGAEGLYFDPLDPEDAAAVMSRILEDPALREAQRRRGLARAAELSWSRSARATLELLEALGRG